MNDTLVKEITQMYLKEKNYTFQRKILTSGNLPVYQEKNAAPEMFSQQMWTSEKDTVFLDGETAGGAVKVCVSSHLQDSSERPAGDLNHQDTLVKCC